MKVLVTGGAGFIGSHTAESLLLRGDQVVVVDELNDYYDLNQKEANLKLLFELAQKSGGYFRFYKADIADREAMSWVFEQEQGFDVVCHLAARAGVRPSIQVSLKQLIVFDCVFVSLYCQRRSAILYQQRL
jgi:UDP-glucuronate 4-epimerase